jgi:hypothetical protein
VHGKKPNREAEALLRTVAALWSRAVWPLSSALDIYGIYYLENRRKQAKIQGNIHKRHRYSTWAPKKNIKKEEEVDREREPTQLELLAYYKKDFFVVISYNTSRWILLLPHPVSSFHCHDSGFYPTEIIFFSFLSSPPSLRSETEKFSDNSFASFSKCSSGSLSGLVYMMAWLYLQIYFYTTLLRHSD